MNIWSNLFKLLKLTKLNEIIITVKEICGLRVILNAF